MSNGALVVWLTCVFAINLCAAPHPLVTSKSGLQYQILREGKGPRAKPGDHVRIHEATTPGLGNGFRFGCKSMKPNRRTPTDVSFADANAAAGISAVTIPTEADVWGMSRVQFTSGFGFLVLGGSFNQPNGKDIQSIQYADILNWTRGNHNLKFGADPPFDHSNIFGGKNARSGFVFDGRHTGIRLGDGVLGWVRPIQESGLDIAQHRFQSYMSTVQDDWKVTPTFTLNLGLRWELRTS